MECDQKSEKKTLEGTGFIKKKTSKKTQTRKKGKQNKTKPNQPTKLQKTKPKQTKQGRSSVDPHCNTSTTDVHVSFPLLGNGTYRRGFLAINSL